MKIARVEGLSVHSVWRKNFVFVRVETDAGVVGEAYSQYDRDRPFPLRSKSLAAFSSVAIPSNPHPSHPADRIRRLCATAPLASRANEHPGVEGILAKDRQPLAGIVASFGR
jgi:hypothetical protein